MDGRAAVADEHTVGGLTGRRRRGFEPLRGAVRRLGSSEDGIALVLALIVMSVLTITVTSVITRTTSSVRQSRSSGASANASDLAESALNLAEATLYNSSDPTTQAGTPGMPSSKPATPQVTVGQGKEWYWGTFDSTSNKWTLYGAATMPNPAAIGSVFSRQVSRREKVTPGTVTNDLRSWNGLYAASTTGCLTLSGGVTLTDPAYIRGNFCMSGGTTFTGSSLQVLGTFSLSGGSNVGTSSTPISRVSVSGTTTVAAGSNIYATTVNRTPDTESEPAVSISGWYTAANIGPKSPCTTSSGTVPVFDSDTTQNWGDAAINLTPGGTPYSCIKKDASGNVVGQLTWNGSSTLTVAGTIFFDGPVVINGGTSAVYTGMATIYAASYSFTGGASLCGIASCTTSWNSATNLLVLVAGKGNTGSPGDFYISNGATFQGGVYCVGDANLTGGSTMNGPITANEIYLSGGAILPKSITILPAGAPADTTTTAPSVAPDPYSYGG